VGEQWQGVPALGVFHHALHETVGELQACPARRPHDGLGEPGAPQRREQHRIVDEVDQSLVAQRDAKKLGAQRSQDP
jgi:hypothetical protein